MANFAINDRFSSVDELKIAIKSFEEEKNIIITIKDSETIKKASRKLLWVRKADSEKLYYKYIRYCCYKSGSFKGKGNGKRNRKSMRENCPWTLLVILDQDCQNLVVKSFIDVHNHELNRDIVERHHKRRKLNQEETEMVSELLSVKGDKKMIQSKIIEVTGKKVILRDLHNLSNKLRQKKSETADELLKHEKLRRARMTCLSLAAVLSQLPTETFYENLAIVNSLEAMFRSQKRCAVVEIGQQLPSTSSYGTICITDPLDHSVVVKSECQSSSQLVSTSSDGTMYITDPLHPSVVTQDQQLRATSSDGTMTNCVTDHIYHSVLTQAQQLPKHQAMGNGV